jgi:hypothetical protein
MGAWDPTVTSLANDGGDWPRSRSTKNRIGSKGRTGVQVSVDPVTARIITTREGPVERGPTY